MKKPDIAMAKFQEGYNCAQSVLYSFCDDMRFDKDAALKLACGFGAGMGRKEEVCGAVTGGIMVLGLRYGRDGDHDKSLTEKTYQKTRELMDRFAEKHGSYLCRNLLGGCDLASPEGQKEFKEKDLLNKVCRECVGSVVGIVESLMV